MPLPVPVPIRDTLSPEAARDLIDEFGDLSLKLTHLAPEIARHAVLKESLAALANAHPGDCSCVVAGRRWRVQFKPRENQRRITNPRKCFDALKKIIGIDGVIALIKIPLEAAIDKHVPKAMHPQFLIQERTGSREMTVVPLHPPVEIEKAA